MRADRGDAEQMKSHAVDRIRFIILPIASAALAGCSLQGAPSFVLFGAFFPAWLLLAVIGVLIAGLARFALVATRLDAVLPYQLAVCISVGLIAAVIIWAIGFAA